MRRGLICILLVALPVSTLRAQDKPSGTSAPSKASEELRQLKQEFEAAQNAFFGLRNELARQFQATKDPATRKELEEKLQAWTERFAEDRPITKFGPRFLQFAEKYSPNPTGIEALALVLREEYRIDSARKGKDTLWGRTIRILEQEYIRVPEVAQLLPLLAYSGDAASEKIVRAVLEKNPDRVTQARAAQALANAGDRAAALASQLKKDEAFRKQLESRFGKTVVEKLIAKEEKERQSATELRDLLKRKYGDIVPSLAVGTIAPDAKGQDLNGKEVKLSDFRGKVVVLDIWTTSCVPCRAMIPHQRELVKKLKGKPFALISISADPNKETLKEFLKMESMPWIHWWTGREGGIVEDWNVQHFPTIYVLDPKGIIRYKDRDGEFPAKKLHEAIMTLLKEVGENN